MLVALMATLAAAQDGPQQEWTPIVSVRPRFSAGYSDGLAFGVLEDPAVTHRARLGMEFERGTVSTRVVAQLASGWQAEAGGYTFVPPGVDFYEAWGALAASLPAKIEAGVTAGRMAVQIHEGRLISRDDFSWDSQSVDGLHLWWSLGSFHQDTVTYRHPDPDPTIVRGAVMTWVGFRDSDALTDWVADLVTVNDYRGPSLRTTVGPFLSWKKGRMHLQGEFYGQTLADDVLGDLTESSLLGSALVGVTLGPERLVSTKARLDVMTPDLIGNRAGFTPPLGDSYRFLGHLGLFQTGRAADKRGVTDVAALVALSPMPQLQFEIDGHQFWFGDGPSAGQELDVLTRYHVSAAARVELGIAAFAPTQATAERYELPSVPTRAYFQLEVQALPRR